MFSSMEKFITAVFICILFAANSARAKDHSLHCKLFEAGTEKLLVIGGAFSGTVSKSREVPGSGYSLVVNHMSKEKQLVQVISKASQKTVLEIEMIFSSKKTAPVIFATKSEILDLKCNYQ